MKRFLASLLALHLFCAFAIGESKTPVREKKTLIAYFSLIAIVPEDADAVTYATPAVGSTESAALEIQRQVGGDLFAIETEKTYPVRHQECSAVAEAEMHADERPQLSSYLENMDDYDTIFVGYPLWWYQEPMVIRSFFAAYDFSGKTIVPFCTSLAVDISQSEENIKSLLPNATVLPGITLHTGQADWNDEIDSWLTDIGMRSSDAAEETAITLRIGNQVLNAVLNDSAPAKSLIEQLPLTVVLNDSDNDFCGGYLHLNYSDSDVTSGYHNGDLAFWTPANNFVIFVDDEETSANIGDLVLLGKITESQDVLDALEGRIEVTIALAQNQQEPQSENEMEAATMKVKITVGSTELTAVMEKNATTQALIEQMPMTLPMMDLYGREMCYRYGAYALPTDSLRSDGYEIGDIAYWVPGGSLVILYAQNGERFERQHLGHIESGVEIFETTGDTEVTFELME